MTLIGLIFCVLQAFFYEQTGVPKLSNIFLQPIPCLSLEGSFQHRRRKPEFPSWEGQGVGEQNAVETER